MIPRVKEVEVVGPHSLRLTFHDGATKRVNLLPLLQGPIFQPLLQPSYFGQVLLDPVAGTGTIRGAWRDLGMDPPRDRFV